MAYRTLSHLPCAIQTTLMNLSLELVVEYPSGEVWIVGEIAETDSAMVYNARLVLPSKDFAALAGQTTKQWAFTVRNGLVVRSIPSDADISKRWAERLHQYDAKHRSVDLRTVPCSYFRDDTGGVRICLARGEKAAVR